jgi:hypothetical protein
MQNTIKILICFMLLCGMMLKADLAEIISFGAPPSSTGAPGEMTCAESGCHDDGPKPISHEKHTFSIEPKSGGFIPGDTAVITIQVKDENILRFGFQLTAVDKQGKSAGRFIVSDPEHTQILQNHVYMTDREYVTYTKSGTKAHIPGTHSWACKWIIPQNYSEDITFYLATVSANNDNRDKGDKVFLRDTVITIQSTNTLQTLENTSIQQKGNFVIIQQDIIPQPIRLYSIAGHLHAEFPAETGELIIDLNEFSRGFYILGIGSLMQPILH